MNKENDFESKIFSGDIFVAIPIIDHLLKPECRGIGAMKSYELRLLFQSLFGIYDSIEKSRIDLLNNNEMNDNEKQSAWQEILNKPHEIINFNKVSIILNDKTSSIPICGDDIERTKKFINWIKQ